MPQLQQHLQRAARTLASASIHHALFFCDSFRAPTLRLRHPVPSPHSPLPLLSLFSVIFTLHFAGPMAPSASDSWSETECDVAAMVDGDVD